MKILSLECASRQASCALLDDGALVFEGFLAAGRTHSQTLLPLAQAMLQTAGLSAGDADGFAVAAGPGSFTGVRIGVAALKGLAMGTGKPCAGVSTLAAIAENFSGLSGAQVLCLMDARCGQVYAALFELASGCVRRLCEDAALSMQALLQTLPFDGPPLYLAGDGAALFDTFLSGRLPRARLAPQALRDARASGVARAASALFAAGEACGAADLKPIYLRPPQAERELARKQKEAYDA